MGQGQSHRQRRCPRQSDLHPNQGAQETTVEHRCLFAKSACIGKSRKARGVLCLERSPTPTLTFYPPTTCLPFHLQKSGPQLSSPAAAASSGHQGAAAQRQSQPGTRTWPALRTNGAGPLDRLCLPPSAPRNSGDRQCKGENVSRERKKAE